MRKIVITLWLAAAAAVLWQTPAKAEKQVLRMAYWAGASHQMVQTLAAWIKTIEEASGGNLTVEVDKAALAKMEGPESSPRLDFRKNTPLDTGTAVQTGWQVQSATLTRCLGE